MSIGSELGAWLARPGAIARDRAESLMKRFVDRPDLAMPADAQLKDYLVEDTRAGMRDHFVQSGRQQPLQQGTGAVLDMVPKVEGGFREGDIVLAAYTVDDAAKSGLVTSLNEGLTKGDWQVHPASVSHAGIVARNDQGELRVIHFRGGRQPDELRDHLTRFQKTLDSNPKFLREDSFSDFFNLRVKGIPSTRSLVMRPKDPQAAGRAAQRAKEYLKTQVEKGPDGEVVGVKPWFNGMPHTFAPDGRGGACSTFVDLSYGEAFKSTLHLPTTPETLAISDQLGQVGDRRIVQARASGKAFSEGTLRIAR